MGVDTLLIVKWLKLPAVRFVLVGGAAFVLDAAVVWLLTHFGMSAYVARVISLCLSIMFTFLANRALTFGISDALRLVEFGSYVGASFLGVAINYSVYAGLMKAGLPWLPAMVVGTVIASFFNFFAYRRIFKR